LPGGIVAAVLGKQKFPEVKTAQARRWPPLLPAGGLSTCCGGIRTTPFTRRATRFRGVQKAAPWKVGPPRLKRLGPESEVTARNFSPLEQIARPTEIAASSGSFSEGKQFADGRLGRELRT